MVLVPAGVALIALFGPVGSAAGFGVLFTGVLVVLVSQYAFGLSTGHFPVSPRYSVLGIVAFSGLILTAFIASIERLF
jgi:ABC-type transport system involved in cytochrome c biogenesis permease subunit